VGDDFQLWLIHYLCAKALEPLVTHVSALWIISFALINICIKRCRSTTDNLRMNISDPVDGRAIA
jgi:hypothetical protein